MPWISWDRVEQLFRHASVLLRRVVSSVWSFRELIGTFYETALRARDYMNQEQAAVRQGGKAQRWYDRRSPWARGMSKAVLLNCVL